MVDSAELGAEVLHRVYTPSLEDQSKSALHKLSQGSGPPNSETHWHVVLMQESGLLAAMTVRHTKCSPGGLNRWMGFCSMLVVPSPNSQQYRTGIPLVAD